ncbi:MAG: hypothetical protein WCO03_02875, partial [bacterium]
NISEAGINYYLWHLSHNNTDYCDGQACVGSGPYGPYVHEYKDTSGVVVGKYTLTITPPISGGTTATVRSEGEKTATGEKRTIISTLGMPSFSEYSYVSDYEVWFGSAESTQGLVHSNRGVHYDGTAAGVVSSTASSYIPTTCFGGDGHTSQNGVWGNGGPKSYWQFPVPKVDFSLISANLQELRTKSLETGGLHIANSNKYGYKLVLNGNTVTVSTVKKANNDGSQNNGCISSPGYNSLINEVINPVTYNLPSNGVIFVDDNVWVSGTLDSRLTIATGQFPEKASTYTKIFLQNNIIYSAYDGSAALGLIAQSDIVINSSSANNLEIDGYLMSQYGNIFRPYYSGNTKNHIKIYGGIALNKSWTWNWVNGSGIVVSGYKTTEPVYDNNLALRPPPEFPTTGSFAILSWKEEPIL